MAGYGLKGHDKLFFFKWYAMYADEWECNGMWMDAMYFFCFSRYKVSQVQGTDER